MTRIANAAIVLTPRDLVVLRTLGTARVLDGEQVRIVAGFASLRRTNRRLLKLVRSGFLRRWFANTKSGGQRALYALSSRGARQVDLEFHRIFPFKEDSIISTSQFLTHQQAVNAVFMRVRFGALPSGMSYERWLSFQLPLSTSVPLVPDAYFEIRRDGALDPVFLEMDLGTESAKVWARKAELYLKFALDGEFPRLFHYPLFRVAVVLPSERRLQSVRKTVAKQTEKLFWFATQEDVDREGLWHRVWFRPSGEEQVCLL